MNRMKIGLACGLLVASVSVMRADDPPKQERVRPERSAERPAPSDRPAPARNPAPAQQQPQQRERPAPPSQDRQPQQQAIPQQRQRPDFQNTRPQPQQNPSPAYNRDRVGGYQGNGRPSNNAPASNSGGMNRSNGRNDAGGRPSYGAAQPNYNVGRSVETGRGQAQVRRDGRVAEVRATNGMVIRRGPAGERRVVVERNDHVYSFNRAGYGHVRTEYVYGGHEYAVRHYYVAGAVFPRYYRPYTYRGVFIDAYTPVVFYTPAYYGWAYHPWGRGFSFNWGWGASPWYGYYGGYFNPYPVYSSGPMWLTDYMLSQTLDSAYRERLESAAAANNAYSNQGDPYQYQSQQQQQTPPNYPPPTGVVALTPEVKQLIAEEVQRQIALEMSEANSQGPSVQNSSYNSPDPGFSGVAKMLSDGIPHMFVSNANIDVATTSGQECMVRQGDVLQLNPGGDPNDPLVPLTVMSTTGGGCGRGSVVNISVQDLQEMQNHMRATIDMGLGEMKSKQGQGLPPIPGGVPVTTTNAEFMSAAPPADANDARELRQLSVEAAQTEQSVVSEVSPSKRAVDLQVGMTVDQVIQMMGTPTTSFSNGSKRIMQYPNLKLTFVDGRLNDVQ